MGKRRIVALALGGAVLLGGVGAGLEGPTAAWANADDLAAPEASIESGRYEGAQTVELRAQEGAEIRFTLDGTRPTRASELYTGPIGVERSANLTAIAFTQHAESAPVIRGLLIKTAEEPLAQFAVMSDIHLSSDGADLVTKWQTYFDALKRIVPDPDAIVSNGDQINDNNHDTAADHRFPRAMLEQNLARTGMTGTDVYLTFGNHDDYVERMAAQYPEAWFPGKAGYYETEIGGFPAFMVNTESWNQAQAGWLYGRLTELSQDPGTRGKPIFVFGHRPIPSTVWDGAQASNPGLKSNLADFPQVVYFSGHSHLNISDERSIHQESFTSVNEGSMSYEEIDSMYQPFGAGLAQEHTVPTAQSVVVEVYADRVEIDRINYAADAGRTYDDAGAWRFQKEPPFSSTGTLAGPSWVIARGADPEAVKAGFTYTQANRNRVAPAWGEAAPTVRETESGPVLRLPQASDDQFVNDYTIGLRDLETGERADLVPAGGRVYADYIVSPRPATLDIPLAMRRNDRVGQPIDRTLVDGHEYEATIVAADSYRNASAPRTFRFVAGALDREALDAAIAHAAEVIGGVERVLGIATPAEEGDYTRFIADEEGAKAAIAALRDRLAADPATQDAVDAAAREIAVGADGLERLLETVDRAPLGAAIDRAEAALGGAAAGGVAEDPAGEEPGGGGPAQALRAAIGRATGTLETLNRSQQQLDAATADLDAALAAYLDATEGADASADASADADAGAGSEGAADAGGSDAGGSDAGGSAEGGSDVGGAGPAGAAGAGSRASGTVASATAGASGGALADTGAPGAPVWVAGLAALLVGGGAWAAASGARTRRIRGAETR